MLVVSALESEPQGVATLSQSYATDIDPGDESQIRLAILRNIDLLHRVAEINALPIALIPLIRQLRLDRITANPEMKIALLSNCDLESCLRTCTLGKM